jgi:hypothetical protein
MTDKEIEAEIEIDGHDVVRVGELTILSCWFWNPKSQISGIDGSF